MDAVLIRGYVHDAILTVFLSVGGWLIMFPVRSLISGVKEKWASTAKMLQEVHEELVQQRTNCLTTLQNQGDKQIEVLQEMSKTLTEMHLDQKQTLGMLQARK